MRGIFTTVLSVISDTLAREKRRWLEMRTPTSPRWRICANNEEYGSKESTLQLKGRGRVQPRVRLLRSALSLCEHDQ